MSHCIDCKQCVVVCPTGIDIRNGLQMECIACGLCVDACDGVMEKIGLPKGLIRYDTLANLENPTPQNKFKIAKPRTFYYATILFAVCSIMMYNLTFKSELEVSAIPDRNPVFVLLSDGSIRNGYNLKITNKTHEEKTFLISLSDGNFEQLKIQEENLSNEVKVKGDSMESVKAFVIIDKKHLNEAEKMRLIHFVVKDKNSNIEEKIEAVFLSSH